MSSRLKIGLLINPVAGLGGRVALKGSDSEAIQQKALALGAKPEAEQRSKQALMPLLESSEKISFYSIDGAMGGDLLNSLGLSYINCYQPENLDKTAEQDTLLAAAKFVEHQVDIILFAGGDGTARNILQAVGSEQLCLGIPAGCKIYSGVFTVTPEDAGSLLKQLVDGELVDLQESSVLDINEDDYRLGQMSTKVFGEMLTPKNGNFVQSVKVSGKESEELVQQEIAAWIAENIQEDTLYFIGSGSTCLVIKDELGIDGSLLGVDVLLNEHCIARDATEQELLAIINEHPELPVKLILTIIAGQGILLGRGNHQVCHKVIEKLGKENLMVVASKGKITDLAGKPLAVDTGNAELNASFSGYIPVITGYDDSILYPIA